MIVPITRPEDKDLAPFRDKIGKLPNYAQDHVLNSEKALARATKEVTAYCFNGSTSV